MANRRLLVLVNLRASRAEQSVGNAVGFLATSGFDLDIRQVEDANTIPGIVADAGPHEAIIVAGGDGTFSSAIPALLEAGIPAGILPFGTANDLALTLGIPADPLAAAAIIAAGHRRRIDVSRVNDVPFINVASIGISVEIAQRQNAEMKRQWGVLSYAITALRTLGEAEPFEAVITCDGARHEVLAYQIAVGNGVHYGGGLTVASDAAIDDGVLDIYAVETGSVAELLAMAPLLRDGTLGERDDVRVFRGRHVTVETAEPMPVNTDGEVTTETPATFSVQPAALEIFVPQPAA